MEANGAPGRLSIIGFTFESLYGRDDAFIVRAPFQRTVVEITESGFSYEPRFGEEVTISVACPASLASAPPSGD